MTQYRSQNGKYSIGNLPPQLTWTIVKGDTASFRVYTVDDTNTPLNIPDWTMAMEIKRPNDPANKGIITDDAELVVELYPTKTSSDNAGEFTVFMNSTNSQLVQTGDIFDIEITDGFRVWTLGQGSIIVIEDVTN